MVMAGIAKGALDALLSPVEGTITAQIVEGLAIWLLFSRLWLAVTRLGLQKLPAAQLKRIVGRPAARNAHAREEQRQRISRVYAISCIMSRGSNNGC